MQEHISRHRLAASAVRLSAEKQVFRWFCRFRASSLAAAVPFVSEVFADAFIKGHVAEATSIAVEIVKRIPIRSALPCSRDDGW